MSDIDRIDERLAAVERAVVDGEFEAPGLAELATVAADVERVETRLEDYEGRLAELEAKTASIAGFVGRVESVNDDVEREAATAVAAVDRLERRVESLENALDPGERDGPAGNAGTRGDAGGATTATGTGACPTDAPADRPRQSNRDDGTGGADPRDGIDDVPSAAAIDDPDAAVEAILGSGAAEGDESTAPDADETAADVETAAGADETRTSIESSDASIESAFRGSGAATDGGSPGVGRDRSASQEAVARRLGGDRSAEADRSASTDAGRLTGGSGGESGAGGGLLASIRTRLS